MTWLIGFILAAGFFLRVFGIWFGLPDLYHADEPIVVNHAMAYGTGDLNPHFFNIPPLVSYLLFFIYGIYYLIGKAFSWFSGTGDFLNLFMVDPASFYLMGRILFGTALGTASLYLLYRLGKKFFSAEHGILAALFLAFNFLHVRDSHYIYVDIPLMTVLIASFFPLLYLTDKLSLKSYLWFGFLLGLAVATKYNGALAVVPFLTVHGLKHRFKLIPLILVASVSLVTYSILNPYTWLDFKFFFFEVFEQGKAEGFIGFTHHFLYSLVGAAGWPVLMLSLLGAVVTLVKKDLKWIAVSVFVLTYYFVLCVKSQPYDRYVLPLIPFVVLLAAEGLTIVKEFFKLNRVLYFLLIIAAVLPSIVKIGWLDYILVQKDTRTLSREWFEISVPNAAKVALDSPFYMPRLKPTFKQLEQKKSELLEAEDLHQSAKLLKLEAMIGQAKEGHKPRYELYYLTQEVGSAGFLLATPQIAYDLNALTEQQIEYVVASQMNREESEFLNALREKADLVASFSPYRNRAVQYPLDDRPITGAPFLWKDLAARQRNGPIIQIYRLRTN